MVENEGEATLKLHWPGMLSAAFSQLVHCPNLHNLQIFFGVGNLYQPIFCVKLILAHLCFFAKKVRTSGII